MNAANPKLQTKTLRSAKGPDRYSLYRAAQEWDLADPILIRDKDDLKSEPKWREHIEPYHHQIQNLITFCRRLPVTLLADDVGLGKTISAGLVASELMARKRISKILVVCPKLLIPQWKEELETKFGIVGVPATGKDLLEATVPDEGGAVITTYQSARMYLDGLKQSGFEMLVLDEAHKLRNLFGVDQPPQVALRFREALADRMFKYVLMLTATPIHNRLWDIYSLVDLLSVARGHQNPFGSEGVFARTFIADDHLSARKLAPNMRESFRSVVYSYMSRIRRADAHLHFPERIVQLHRVDPLDEELELIRLVGKNIQVLNRLAQISILQALVSSPHALNSQLKRMARNKTIPESFAISVDQVVSQIRMTAKLQGLASLVQGLSAEQPERWRMVVFTTRRETQTTIESFLQERGISCGLINGESGDRNQRTIARFKKAIPEIHVIVSTEAGSEGVNLQAANVLVNFDLPWNPMIVEQRIGRIQRLASQHASVCIFNIILRGTFEEYIVGRLMEKLQMASQAIGDIEALLEASGMSDHEDDGVGFEEQIRQLVVASLAGKDVESATRMAEQSITEAKVELQAQEKSIDTLLGAMDDAHRNEVPYPHLPIASKSMDSQTFVLTAMRSLGTNLVLDPDGSYVAELDGKLNRICFDEAHSGKAVLYRPGAPAFSRLVSQIAGEGLHLVQDIDDKATPKAHLIAKEWIESFGGLFRAAQVQSVARSFSGTATVRVRAAVAHDSYERLVDVSVAPEEHWVPAGPTGASPISDPLKNPEAVGINPAAITEKATQDEGLSEFCRFYLERKKQELEGAGDDARKQRKIEDDFTPRLEALLIGLDGVVRRKLAVRGTFALNGGPEYHAEIAVIPSQQKITNAPELARCSSTNLVAPSDCLALCQISNSLVFKHLLKESEISGRKALPQFFGVCAETGKQVLPDELERSAISQNLVVKSALKTSGVSGKRAENKYFGKCDFTDTDALLEELAVSQISGKRYRRDREQRSVVGSKTGFDEEFTTCAETGRPLLANEAARCEITGKLVIPGLLAACEATGKNVLPSELEKSSISGKRALKQLFVTSSISGARFLHHEGIQSATGKFCVPTEAKPCMWSGRKCHPEDLRTCQLTLVTAHFEFMTTTGGIRFEPLVNLLNGLTHRAEKSESWAEIALRVPEAKEGRSQIQSSTASPDGSCLAVCVEKRNFLGLHLRHAGFLYSIRDRLLTGRVVIGKREPGGWTLERVL